MFSVTGVQEQRIMDERSREERITEERSTEERSTEEGSTEWSGDNVAIRVRDAYKSYGHSPVLTGLHMTVPQASIYGLLGPSGCGKTTLLNCIVGRSKLDYGDIYVKVKTKAKMGYMPQDLALFTQFTIEETLRYFGQIYGMSSEDLQARIEELSKSLELPPRHQSVETLSGGQQRRVSLTVALLHCPELLILDEPTVGVDPLLSHSIWKQLIHMSTVGKKTIVITTHYIEEARQAQTIGLLRHGQLLAEQEPHALMRTYQVSTLEKAFLLLSQKQSNNNNLIKHKAHVPTFMDTFNLRKKKQTSQVMREGRGLKFCRIKAQMMKAGFWMKHNLAIMGFLVMLPIVQSVLFCLTVGLDPVDLPLGVVNLETADQPCPQVPLKHNCTPYLLSCLYLHRLKTEKLINLVSFRSEEEARAGVTSNNVWGYVFVPANYSASLLDRIGLNIDSPEPSLDFSQVYISMDMSNQYIGNLLRRDLLFGQIEFLKSLYEDCGWPSAAAGVPIHFEDAVYGDNRPSFAHFAVPAVIQLFEFYLPMMFTVGAILMEKRDGILERSLVTGITLKETLISHVIVQVCLLAVQTALMMIVLFVVFDNPLKGSLPLCLALLFLIGINGMCYGFFVSTLCDLDSAALYLGLGSFFPLAMLSGMVWPMEGMHWSLRAVGWLLPLTQTTESFRAISCRAWTFTHPTVYRGFISAAGWTVVFSVATYLIVKAQNGIRGSLRIFFLPSLY